LTGVVVALWSVSFPVSVLNQNLERVEALSVQAAGLKADIQSLRESGSAAKTHADSLQLANTAQDLRRTNEVMGAKLAIIHRLNTQSRWLPALAAFGFVTGTAIAAVGFALWYYRVQQFQDAVAKKQSIG